MGRGIALTDRIGDVHHAVDRLARTIAARRWGYAVAPLLLGASAVLIEVFLVPYGHGTHLLFLLLIVAALAFRTGPGPAAVALGIGSIGSAVASVAGPGPEDPLPITVFQLVLYGLAGAAFLVVLARAASGHRQPTARLSPFPAPMPLLDRLTPRELEVLRLVAAGMSVEQIGESLVVSPNTVKTHLSHAYQKLGAHNRPEAVRAAIHCGCLTAGDICPHQATGSARDPSNG